MTRHIKKSNNYNQNKKNLIIFIFLAICLFLAVILFLAQNGKGKYVQAAPSGTGQYFQGNGGYGKIANANFTDLDYMKDFSVETVVDIKPYENKTANWPGIAAKTSNMGLYNASYAGWGMGVYAYQEYGARIATKVGDGNNHTQATSNNYTGRLHLVMAWNAASKILTLYVNGNKENESTNASVNLSGIKNTNDFWLAKSFSGFKSPILYVRLWNRDLSSDVATLYNYYNTTKQHELPLGFDESELVSEWLMYEKSNSAGSEGITHLKDTKSSNHIELVGGADMVSADGVLALSFPANGAINQNKAVTLRAQGGYDVLSQSGAVKGPVQYYFQIDESPNFNSVNLKESDWIADFNYWQPILKPSTVYYWKVKVKDSVNLESLYTSANSFSTEGPMNWYVRPAGGSYGAENGASYANAWDGLLNVVWGENGVEAGDNLYVAGSHIYDMEKWKSNGGFVNITTSGFSDDYSVTVRGDYPGDSGVIWGAHKPSYAFWQGPDANGVYSTTLTGNTFGDWFFQDVTQSSFIVLNKKNSAAEVGLSSGSFYLDEKNLYAKTTDGGNPAGRILVPTAGYLFDFGVNQYIKFYNFKWYRPAWGCSYSYDSSDRCSHLRWEGLAVKYGMHSFFGFRDGMDYMQVVDCDLSWASNGIYNISSTNNAPSHYLFKGNIIHDIGVRESTQNGDAHCIGIQGGHDGLIEDNICYNAGTGPSIYAFTNQNISNVIFRRNFVNNLHTLGSATGYGMFTMCNNDSLSDKTDIMFYSNIVANAPFCYRLQFEDEQNIFNNIGYNCANGIASSRNYNNNVAADINAKNNIFLNSTDKHIYWNSGAKSGFTVNFDYNDYYPDAGKMFLKHNVGGTSEKNFNEWQASAKAGSIFDPHSISQDPLFINLSGDYSSASDFAPLWNSPAIDAGTDAGLASDYFNKPIYGPPDIGAVEYQPPYIMGMDKPDISADVRIYGDGKFRNKKNPAGEAASLSIAPRNGGARQWLDVVVETWNKAGGCGKKWSESSPNFGSMTTAHEVGDLASGKTYAVYYTKDGEAAVKLSVKQADSSGRIMFDYNSGYSEVIFEIKEEGSSADSSSSSAASSASAPSSSSSSAKIGDLPNTDNVDYIVEAEKTKQNASIADEAEIIFNHNQFVKLDQITLPLYQKLMAESGQTVDIKSRYAIAYFIHYGAPAAKRLGAGERVGVVSSFAAAYGRWPAAIGDWQDIIKIANGRWPVARNARAENRAKNEFKKIYRREPDINNAYDNNAMAVMAYGLRPTQRNIENEKIAIKIFKAIYKHNPLFGVDWDAIRAIAYSGAKR